MNAMIPDVMQLLTFYSISPVSTATSAERTFSHLRRIKNYLRNTVAAEARLTDAALRLPRDGGQPEHIDKLMDAFIIRNDPHRK